MVLFALLVYQCPKSCKSNDLLTFANDLPSEMGATKLLSHSASSELVGFTVRVPRQRVVRARALESLPSLPCAFRV